jgi:polyisoprenoid-binding protein YceI
MSIDTGNIADVTKETAMSSRSEETLVGQWQLDPERSSVEFRVGHFWGLATVKGQFDRYEGRLDLGADPAIELTIEAASVQTGNRRRDKHLRSPDFFGAEKQPQVRFVSDTVVSQDDTLKVRGSLFAGDRSIPLELDARIRRVDGDLQIEASTSAPHRELGMTYSPLGMIAPRSELLVNGYLLPTT